MSYVLGLNHKLYYQSTGTRATWPDAGTPPNLVEVDNCADLTFSGDTATGDVSTRGGGTFRQLVATLSDAEVEFEMVYDTSDTAFTFLQARWIDKTAFGAAVLDGDSETNGVQGIWMDAVVTGWEWNQELEEAGRVKVKLTNTYSAVPCESLTVVEGVQWVNPAAGEAYMSLTVNDGEAYTYVPNVDGEDPIGFVGTGEEQTVGFDYTLFTPGSSPYLIYSHGNLIAINNTATGDPIFSEFPDMTKQRSLVALKLDGGFGSSNSVPVLLPSDLTANTDLQIFQLEGDYFYSTQFPDITGLSSLTTFVIDQLNDGDEVDIATMVLPATLPASLVTLKLIGNGESDPSLGVTGTIPTLTGTALQTLHMPYLGISGAFPSLPSSIVDVNLHWNFSLSGDLPDISALSSLASLDVGSTLADNWTSSSVPASLLYLDCSDTSLAESDVDDILVQLDTAGASNGTVDLRYTTAPSATGLAAKTSLEGKGWTVQVTT